MTTPTKTPATKAPAAKTSSSTHTVNIAGDASALLEEIAKVRAALAAVQPKPGSKTSEFYVLGLTLVDDVLVARFHTDFGLKAHEALVLGIVTTAGASIYTAARTWLKARHLKAVS